MNGNESLSIIESMINKAKNNFSESGTLYLLWGFVVLICSLVQFIAIYIFDYQQAYFIWFLTWVVAIYQVIFLRKKASQVKVKTYTDDIIKYVWICFVCTMLIMIFILQHYKAYESINPAILLIYGMPTFLSGIILKVKVLSYGGICCWILSMIAAQVPMVFQPLFISVAVIVAWIIPGLVLRKKYTQQNIDYGRA
jgi:hypothetical protein